MKHAVFFAIIVLLTGCNCNDRQPFSKQIAGTSQPTLPPDSEVVFILDDTTLLTGKPVLHFYYHDASGKGHSILLNKKRTTGHIPAQTFLIQADDHQTPFLVYAGETIHVKSDTTSAITFFVPGHQERTNELNFFSKAVQQTGPVYTEDFRFVARFSKQLHTVAEADSAAAEMDSIKQQRKRLLHTYAKQYPVSDTFKNVAEIIFDYAAVNDKLIVYWLNKQRLPANSYRQMIDTHIRQLNDMPFCNSYICYKALHNTVSMANTPYLNNYIFDSVDWARKVDFTAKNYRGLQKDFLVTSMTLRALDAKITMPVNYMQQYHAVCGNNTFKSLLESHLRNKQQQLQYPKGSNMLMSAGDAKPLTLETLLKNNRGKLILLDFWASWCSPCRNEMPASLQRSREMKGKDIVFIYISTDAHKQDWQKATKEEELPAENSYWLTDAATSSFLVKNKISAIPRYMLIGKEGQLIEAEAPRPGDAGFRSFINKHL